ncbi:hypothetical protein THAOC_10644 [Thalassiosira oceanica]|uniref:Uncharacterized protein n=1 Tax=Thalassiosira oceanica TaxID=159749 RepID=K0SS65_THAOC|nr:hypothetical protein THAOC_10644 [Thalassiosira oceanica]|eukprot:EJK68200.1 hypothetical protein THAOC_10644 [Thalassiosira oceanica]
MYLKTLINFTKNKTKAANVRTRNDAKEYGRRENGTVTSRSFPVLDGEPEDIGHMTEELLKAVTSLETNHWTPHNINNTERFNTVRDLCKEDSPLQSAFDRVVRNHYPNPNQQTNNAVPNLVKRTVYELTKQANAGDKVRDALRHVQYLNLVDIDTNQLMEPSRVLDRFEEVLRLASRLQTTLADWNETAKFQVLWSYYPDTMKTYFQYERNDGVCPTTDGTTCAALTAELNGYYMQNLNFPGARPERNDGGDRGNKRQRNNRDGGWTPRNNQGNGNGRDGGNGHGGGNANGNFRGNGNGYRGGRNQDRYRGNHNRNHNNRNGQGSNQGGRSNSRFVRDDEVCPLHGGHDWGSCRCNPRNPNFRADSAALFAERNPQSEFNWFRNYLRSRNVRFNTNNQNNSNQNNTQGGGNRNGGYRGNHNEGGNQGGNQGNQGGNQNNNHGGSNSSYMMVPVMPPGLPPVFQPPQNQQQPAQPQSSYWTNPAPSNAPSSNAQSSNNQPPAGAIALANGGFYMPPPS